MKRRAAGIAALPLLYLLVCGGAWLFEPRLVYQPSRTMRSTPAEQGIEFEDLTLTASDGAKIRAWFLPVESPRATVLYAHGTTGNLSTNLKRLLPMREAGFAVLAFDYRGYGTSDLRPLNEEGTYRDGEAAWRWLTTERNVPPEEVVIWGRSLGGGIASQLAAQHPPRALVLESTFTSLVDVGAAELFFLPVRWLANIRYPTQERLPSLRCPVVIAHAKDDVRVPFEHAQANLEFVTGRKAFVETTGGHGGGLAGTSGALEKVAAFFDGAELESPGEQPNSGERL